MYRILAIIGICGTLAAMAALYFIRKKAPLDQLSPDPFSQKVQQIEFLIYAVTGISIFGLAATGFWAAIITGQSSTGYLLMIHCTLAPIFCVGLTATIILGAEKHKFDQSDRTGALPTSTWRKVCFWVLMAAAIPVILSMVLSMLRLFGTVGQEYLYQWHRIGALILTMAGIGFIGLRKTR